MGGFVRGRLWMGGFVGRVGGRGGTRGLWGGVEEGRVEEGRVGGDGDLHGVGDLEMG